MKEFTANNYLEDIRKKIPAYDLMIEIIFNALLKVEFPDLKIPNVLSIAGQTAEIELLLNKYRSDKITLVEPSETMINIVAYECKNISKNSSLEYICKKFEDFETDRKYDLCVCLLVLQFVENPELFLKKIYYKINTKGKFILSIFSNEQLKYWKEFAEARGANREQIERTFLIQKEVMNELSNTYVEKILKKIGFRKIEKVLQVLPVTMWLIEK